MHTEPDFKSIAIVGAGALGSFMAARLRLSGAALRLIGRPAQVQALRRGGLVLHGAGTPQPVDVQADTDIASVQGADLVLVAVKSADTATVAQQLAPWLQAGAVVLSLQNGVENAALLMQALPQARVVAALAYIAAAQPEPGQVQHHGGNELVIGDVSAPAVSPLPALARLLEGAGFVVRVSADVQAELWRKLIVNSAWNAVSALTQTAYGVIATQAGIAELQQAVLNEAVAVAQADGVQLSMPALQAAVQAVALKMAPQRSSTAQDLARGRPSEIDHLNGYIVRRAAVHGMAAPMNQALWALVKLAETRQAAPA